MSRGILMVRLKPIPDHCVRAPRRYLNECYGACLRLLIVVVIVFASATATAGDEGHQKYCYCDKYGFFQRIHGFTSSFVRLFSAHPYRRVGEPCRLRYRS